MTDILVKSGFIILRFEDIKTFEESLKCCSTIICQECPIYKICKDNVEEPRKKFEEEKFKAIISYNRKKKLEKLLS